MTRQAGSTRRTVLAALTAAAATPAAARQSQVQPGLPAQAQAALDQLLQTNPGARRLYDNAVAVLVFPKITKGGFLVGAHSGQGVLYARDQAGGYFQSVGASYGLQIGEETYAYALFFMNDAALASLRAADGFELGTGPTFVVADQAYAKQLTTLNLNKDIYAFIWGQHGLMAGGGVEGTKITQIQ